MARNISGTTWDNGKQRIHSSFQSKIIYLTNQGFKPRFNVMDNIVSTAIREFLENEGMKLEIVEPNNHRINTAERAIQSFKDHFIAGLCTVDSKFPIQLWDQLLGQAQDSLNMLCTARTNPQLSAYHLLKGPHDFNRTLGQLWAPRGIDAWYVGLAKDHSNVTVSSSKKRENTVLPEMKQFIQHIATYPKKHLSTNPPKQPLN
ncbi:hypothetical protein ACHAXS_002436 [Conticribra weissflogii]